MNNLPEYYRKPDDNRAFDIVSLPANYPVLSLQTKRAVRQYEVDEPLTTQFDVAAQRSAIQSLVAFWQSATKTHFLVSQRQLSPARISEFEEAKRQIDTLATEEERGVALSMIDAAASFVDRAPYVYSTSTGGIAMDFTPRGKLVSLAIESGNGLISSFREGIDVRIIIKLNANGKGELLSRFIGELSR